MASAAPAPVLPLLVGERRAGAWPRLAILTAWLCVALWLAHAHVFWRDEVRALTLALSGDGVWGMLRQVHGDGHPALWHLLLRALHLLLGREALPVAAFATGAGAAALFAWRAPFRPLVLAAALFGAFFLHEYTVVARNYGLAMLLLFAFAALYPRWRARGPGLGLLLALICNTNVPAVLLAGGLALFWGVELLCEEGVRPSPHWRHYAGNMALMLLGVAACMAEIYPPFNDAAVSPVAGRVGPAALLWVLGNLAAPFATLMPDGWLQVPFAPVLLAALVVGAPLGLVRSPGGLAAGLAAAVAMPLFFQLVYPGSYRHQALFVAFLLTLYWLVADGGGGRWPARRPPLGPQWRRLGQGAMVALLLAQVAIGAEVVATAAAGVPFSRSRDLADLLRARGLTDAVVIAANDVLLEPLPYYTSNPLWLTRERRWGQVVHFTRAAKRDVSVGELLAAARALRARTGRAVVILLPFPLDPAAPPRVWDQGYVGTVSSTPADTRAFLAATRVLARFPPAVTDESYDAYLLR